MFCGVKANAGPLTAYKNASFLGKHGASLQSSSFKFSDGHSKFHWQQLGLLDRRLERRWWCRKQSLTPLVCALFIAEIQNFLWRSERNIQKKRPVMGVRGRLDGLWGRGRVKSAVSKLAS